ncbi:glycosyltransferase family 4 protein [bacterium]|nr:glycosyltransferase family 4 protein [bacterium]MBU1675855.1 glycosyltransferase family 4 protein [bacterium]
MAGRADGRPLVSAQLVGALQMGGAEHLAVQIANARAVAGDRSHLYVMGGPGPLSAKISPAVTVRYFDHRVASPARPWRCLVSVREGYRLLAASLAADGVDVLQSHLPGANFWGLLLSRRRRCAVVPTVHNNREFAYGDTANPLRTRMRRWAYRRMLKDCNAVVAVSEKVKASLLVELGVGEAAADRLVVIPNGVSEPPPLASDELTRIRARFGCGEGEFLALAAGRHDAQKNYRTLIETMVLLLARGVPLRLVLAGEGPLSEEHRRLCDESGLSARVVMPGNLDDLSRVMQSADCFVMSSLWEGLPLVMLEAMAAGLPVAGTRIPGIEDVIEDGVNGVLADPADAAGLADAVARLAADADLRARCRASALASVRRDYSLDRVSRDLGDLYHRVAGTAGKS